MPRTGSPLTLTLGDLKERVETRVRSGAMHRRAKFCTLQCARWDLEDEALRNALRDEIERSLNDPRPSVPAEKVFARLRQRHAHRAAAGPEKV